LDDLNVEYEVMLDDIEIHDETPWVARPFMVNTMKDAVKLIENADDVPLIRKAVKDVVDEHNEVIYLYIGTEQ
jgi:hypothetical protein